MSSHGNQSLDGSCPPSPAGGRLSARLSWGSLLHRLTELKGVDRGAAVAEDCGSDGVSVADWSLSEASSCSDLDSSFFCYPLEETLAAEVVATIAESLYGAPHILNCSKLLLPDGLLHSIGDELLHLSDSEPCGLRGALIDLLVDRGDQGSLCTVDQIAVDPSLVPTFHVSLVLRLECSGLWPKVQKLFRSGRTTQAPAQRQKHHRTLTLSTSFRAIKRKLYSSAALLIEEC
ncbi:DNA damage-inducible transcript 4 protein-like [Pholidichthys leucotaenia]